MVRSFAILLVSVALYGCLPAKDESPVSSSQSHPVSLQLGSYTTAGISRFLIPEAHAAVSDLRFCFKRLRFKKDTTDTLDPALDDDNVDLMLGEVAIDSAGSNLATVSVPEGTYYRVEFDLEPECAANSVNLTNDFGVFTSGDRITIKFDGVFVVNGAESLVLGTQNILNAANAYNGVGSLRDALENVSGDLQ